MWIFDVYYLVSYVVVPTIVQLLVTVEDYTYQRVGWCKFLLKAPKPFSFCDFIFGPLVSLTNVSLSE